MLVCLDLLSTGSLNGVMVHQQLDDEGHLIRKLVTKSLGKLTLSQL